MRFVHTGDTHIGYRQYGSSTRRKDFLNAFEIVVDDAIDVGVDAFVHAGDLFHNRNPDLPDIIPTIQVLKKLRKAEIPVLAVVGNHERKRDAQWLDLFENLGLVTRLTNSATVIGDTAFYGVDYVPGSRIDDYEYSFEESTSENNVLVLHGRFEPFPYGEWDLEKFLGTGIDWDAFLLGDYHHFEKERIDGVWATYCGSTERVSTAERGSRGYNLVEINDDVNITRRSIPTRDFVYIEVDLSGSSEGTREVVERVREHEVEDSVVIIEIKGESDANVVQSEVEEEAIDRGAIVARVNDRREINSIQDDVEVSFSDPDEAVKDRIGSMNLSDAARSIDSMVRGEEVADTNVKERVEEIVEGFVDSDIDKLVKPDRDQESGGGEGSAKGVAEKSDEGSDQPAVEAGQSSMEDWM